MVEPFRGKLDLAKLVQAVEPVLSDKALPKALVWHDLVIKRKRLRWIPYQLRWPLNDYLLNEQVSHAGRCAIRADVLHDLYQAGKIQDISDTSTALYQIGLIDESTVVEVPGILRFVGRDNSACYKPLRQISPGQSAKSISIVINYRDRPELMATCLTSLAKQRVTADLQVLLVDNQSHPDNRQKVESLARQLLPEVVNVIHLSYDAPFNHSAQSNLAVEHSTGEVVVMFNNDASFMATHTLQTLADWALTPNMASVGPRVVGKYGRLVAAGVEVYSTETGKPGGIRESTVNPLAQTIHYTAGNGFACAAIARKVWFQLGGLDAKAYPTQYNDVDYALKSLDLGLKHLYLGYLTIYHQPGQSEYRTWEQVNKIHNRIQNQYPTFCKYESISPGLVRLQEAILNQVSNPTLHLHLFLGYWQMYIFFEMFWVSFIKNDG